jgi:glycosyltransferase involved in cell wall biosynthesis
MNIIIINHYAGSPALGMEYRPYYLARQWVKMGHDVTIVASTNSHIRKHNSNAKSDFEEENIDDIRYVWVRTPKYEDNGVKRFLNMLSFTSKLWMNSLRFLKLYKPDIVIASSTYTLDNYPAMKIARISKAKYFYEVHDLWPLSPMELGGMSPKHPFIRIMQAGENFAYKNADKVISMLPNTKEHMKSHGLDLSKWRFIPNGICVDEWNEDLKIEKELENEIQSFQAKGKKIIAYTGTLGLANALDNFIYAAKKCVDKDVIFMIFGIGPEQENLQKLIDNEGLENTFIMGAVDKSSIPNLLSKMDFLYIGLQKQPLFKYGISPNKLIDYMMSSKPIIQAIEAGNDMVSEAKCGISIEAENPKYLADAIESLLQKSDEELLEMGERGRVYAMENHTYKKLASRFVEIMEED